MAKACMMACRFPSTLSVLVGGNQSSRKVAHHSGFRFLRTTTSSGRSRQHRPLRSKRQRQFEQEKAAKYDLNVALKRINGIMAASDIINNTDANNNDDITQTRNDLFQHYPHLSEFLRTRANQCQVLPSSLGPEAGRGLFATRKINKGEIVTLYPAHSLGMEIDNSDNKDDDDGDDVSMTVFSSQEDQDYFAANNYKSESGYNLFILDDIEGPTSRTGAISNVITRPSMMATTIFKNLLPPKSIITTNNHNVAYHLDVNPQQPLIPGWQSHIINDGARIFSPAKEADILKYYTETNQNRNSFHIPFGPSPLMATVATRDINEGEEFFTSYDFLYWVVDARSSQQEKPKPTTVVDHYDNDKKGSMVLTDAIEKQTDFMNEALWEATLDVEEQYEPVVKEIAMYFDQIR